MSATSGKLLKTAVHQNKLMSRQGFSQRLFSAWFNSFVYNQIWEDPRVDLEALQIEPHSRLITIASGGCNIVNYLQANPQKIIAVDLNPYHMYLTRLKLAALEHLPDYEAFYDFFGYANRPHNIDNYFKYISPNLEEEAREYWESGFGKGRIKYFKNDLYRYARSGYFLRFVHFLGKRIFGLDPEPLLQASGKGLEAQQKAFDEQIAPFFSHWFIKACGNFSFPVFSLGIPPQQYQAMKEESDGKIVELFGEKIRHMACDFPLEENYFAWQVFGIHYDHENRQAVPDYLKQEHYDAIKSRVSRVDTNIISMTDYLAEQPANTLDRFVLLDAQDWMKPDVITALWTEIARVCRPGGRIIFRTAATDSPVEPALPEDLRKHFIYHEAESRELVKKDRSAIYSGFHLYEYQPKS